MFYEVIFQIGNKDDMNVQSNEGQSAKDILCEFMRHFQKRNPSLYVFSSHMDEQTPHIHIDFVPFIRNSKRGLDTRVSLKGALAEQGFKGGTRGIIYYSSSADCGRAGNKADTERGRSNPQEVAELTTTNYLLKEQTEILSEDKEKLLSEH